MNSLTNRTVCYTTLVPGSQHDCGILVDSMGKRSLLHNNIIDSSFMTGGSSYNNKPSGIVIGTENSPYVRPLLRVSEAGIHLDLFQMAVVPQRVWVDWCAMPRTLWEKVVDVLLHKVW